MTQFMSGFVAAPALGTGFVQPVISGFVQPVKYIFLVNFQFFVLKKIIYFLCELKEAREADTGMFGVFVGDLPQDANEQDLIKLFTVKKNFQEKKHSQMMILHNISGSPYLGGHELCDITRLHFQFCCDDINAQYHHYIFSKTKFSVKKRAHGRNVTSAKLRLVTVFQ